jgi:putative SOS response-associated peptidase YedK
MERNRSVFQRGLSEFLTTTPIALVAAINHERMPVLLTSDEQFETWLTGSPADAFSLAKEFPPDQMHIVQGGFEMMDLLAA